MLLAALIILGILTYALIGRGAYRYSETIIDDPHNDAPFFCGVGWPLAAIYYLVLKYPFRLSDRIGDRVGNWQLKRETKRVEEQNRIRWELQEHLAEVERDLKKALPTLEDQFEELEQQQSRSAHR